MEEASYEFNLRLWNMTKDKLRRRFASSENTEHTNMQLLEAYRRADEMKEVTSKMENRFD